MFAGQGDMLRNGIDQLMREIRRQILADGGHIGRAPETVALLLADFLALSHGLKARNVKPPTNLLNAMRRMQKMLAMLSLCLS